MATGDITEVALGLSLAIRLDPQLAEEVLTVIGNGGSAPLLELVAGDALRLLGRDHEAAASYGRARRPALVDEPEPG